MGLTLGGNNSSFKSIRYLNDAKSKMDNSLLKISSGKRILTAADDSGGLSVAMKLQNQINTTKAQQSAVDNAKSYVEAQSTALQTASEIVTKMQDLKSDYDDATATASDQVAYESEFQDLRKQLDSLKGETLNGTKLFNRTDGDMTVSSVTLTNLDLNAKLQNDDSSGNGNQNIGNSSDTSVTLSTVTVTNLSNISDNVSGLVAEAAGDESTLGFASDYLSNMSVNMESAHGRIMDVDLAEESSNFAKYSMQYEAAAAAVAQANVAMGAVLDLLLSSVNRD